MLDNFYINSGFSMRCIRRTTRGCRLYRSSHAGSQFGSSGSSGFVGGFRRLRLFNCGLAPRGRAYRTRPTSGLEVSFGLRLANFSSIPDILLYQK